MLQSVLQSITEYNRVLQNITEYYRVFLAHLLGPISGLVVFMFVVIADVDVVVFVDDDVGLHALCPPSYGALPSWQQDLSASHNISINISTQYL